MAAEFPLMLRAKSNRPIALGLLCANFGPAFAQEPPDEATRGRPGLPPITFVGEANSYTGERELQIVDGDTIWIGIHQIRLAGIDAVEPDQDCFKNEEAIDCNRAMINALRALLQGEVRCEGYYGADERPRLSYGRYIATCWSNDRNINEEMVRSGWAFAVRRASDDRSADLYEPLEDAAREARLGLFALDNPQKPSEWRASKRSAETCVCPGVGELGDG